MNKEFVTYEQALALKELGFDEPCFAVYYDTKEFKTYTGVWVKFNSEFNGKGVMSAPLYQQAFRWFREKHGYGCYVKGRKAMGFDYTLTDVPTTKAKNDILFSEHVYDTYEEAELACLDKLIEICKNK